MLHYDYQFAAWILAIDSLISLWHCISAKALLYCYHMDPRRKLTVESLSILNYLRIHLGASGQDLKTTVL